MFENAAYGARRGEVSAFLAAHGPAVVAGDDPARREELFAIAGTPDAQRGKVVREIKDLPDGPEWVEQATIIVMVHS